MKWPSKEEVKRLRKEYPEGTIIKLIKMDDPTPVPPGTFGIVDNVDDVGNIHLDWLNYRSSLAIVPGKDEFKVIDAIRYIYPCEECPGLSIDLNDPKPYLCMFDDHHAGMPESLSDNCPQNKQVKIEEVKKEDVCQM